jgi:type III secretion system FlhB-like substrate exporter
MTVKLVLLKSGEDIITDVKEMVVEEKVVGYFLSKPCVIKFKDAPEVSADGKASVNVDLIPWIALSKETNIPVPSDWIITIVEPIDSLKQMYVNNVLSYEINQTNSTDEQSDSSLTN